MYSKDYAHVKKMTNNLDGAKDVSHGFKSKSNRSKIQASPWQILYYQ